MVKLNVITLFPEMIKNFCSSGVLAQAQKKDLINIQTINPRDFARDKHKSVDDKPFGGGDGMLMMAEPLHLALKSIENPGYVIYLTPQGKKMTDAWVRDLQKKTNQLTLVCGRYAGVDQRWINENVDEEISIGDYVLSGGELAAAILIDAYSRFVPGVLGHENSAAQDSISMGHLEAPHFTKPRIWQGQEVPEILLQGHHEKIESWRKNVGFLTTLNKRPDLLAPQLSQKEKQDLKIFWIDLSDKDKKVLGLDELSLDRIESL